MPRTAARTKSSRNKPHLTDTEPKSASTHEASSATPSANRAPDGRFVAGNAGGPGNPHARHCARMLALFRSCITDEEMLTIIRVLVDKASQGDASAAKLLLSYKIGKPAPAPNPDQIDRDEWEHYQKDTINLEEMQQVLSSLPTRVGNDIARTALPIMTEARTRELATQLNCKKPESSDIDVPTQDECEKSEKAAPLPIGNSGQHGRSKDKPRHTEKSTTTGDVPTASVLTAGHRSVSHCDKSKPISNGDSGKHRGKQSPRVPEKNRHKRRAG